MIKEIGRRSADPKRIRRLLSLYPCIVYTDAAVYIFPLIGAGGRETEDAERLEPERLLLVTREPTSASR